MATQTRNSLSRKAVRNLIKQSGKHATQVKSNFYTLLDQRTRNGILKAVVDNAPRKRLTQYELLSNKGSKEVK